MLNESVIEAAHLCMNEFARRFACVTDMEQNLRLRHQAYSHAADLRFKNIKSRTMSVRVASARRLTTAADGQNMTCK